ncbi:hypothetical protein EGI26_10235 [Lacihabitans sp. CCS-44]|uniref:Kelch repeat-containing protein n=1 Tax=Lacihabitans sp. CCS-44 TaxID=2487331 RepID=UPI0020CF4B76|nr:LamG-like jellyroll fold domain-containing protein [Lacihabitans sp. CCS-44]MCP9755533.1 hypothetical protein [Lacihabitans sp. CCS-44]
MKTTSYTPLVIFMLISSLASNFLVAQNTVERKASLGIETPMALERYNGFSFSIGDMGYIGGGQKTVNGQAEGSALNDFWEYNMITNEWTRKADFPGEGKISAVGLTINNKGYVGAGGTKEFWEYNAELDKWTRKADFIDKRTSSAGFSLNGKAYIGTGLAGDNIGPRLRKDFYEYDPLLDIWTQKRDFGGVGIERGIGFSISGKGYIGLGANYQTSSIYQTAIWEYDPLGDTWVQKGNYPTSSTSRSSVATVGDKAYIGMGEGFGGSSGHASSKTFYEYNPNISNSWNYISSTPISARNGAFMFSNLTRVFVGGGRDEFNTYYNFYKADLWELNPSNYSWLQKFSQYNYSVADAASFVLNEKAYVVSGRSEYKGIKKDTWEYSPSNNNWTKKNDLPIGRPGAVSFSINNKGYLGTGNLSYHNNTNDFWEYDPVLDTWSQKANFPGAKRNNAFGFSNGTKGYVGGGSPSNNEYMGLNDFYQYDAITNIWTKLNNIPTDRFNAFTFAANNKIFMGGGRSLLPTGYMKYYSDFYQYIPETDAWIAKQNIPMISEWKYISFGLNKNGYVSGDYVGNPDANNLFFEYNIENDNWNNFGSHSSLSRVSSFSFEVNGVGYFGGGYNVWHSTELNDFWAYNPCKYEEMIPPLTISSERCGPGTDTLEAQNCYGVFRWYQNLTDGNIFLETSSNKVEFKNYESTTKFYVSCACGSLETARSEVEFKINSTPSAPSNVTKEVFSGQYSNIEILGCDDGLVSWYENLNDSYPIFVGNKFKTPDIFNNRNYYASCTKNSCESLNKATINLNLKNCEFSDVFESVMQPEGEYAFKDNLKSKANIYQPISYRAGKNILLEPGFVAENTVFQAEIKDCPEVQTTSPPTIPTDGLLLYCPFNGNANDVSGNSNNGIIQGNPNFILRGSQQALNFSPNSGQFVSVANNSSFQNLTSMTLSAWIKPSLFDLNCYTEREQLIGKGKDVSDNAFGLSIQRNITPSSCGEASSFDSYKLNFELGSSTISSPIYSIDNIWKHVLCTYDGVNQKIYVDGILMLQATVGAINTTNSIPLYFNYSTWDGGYSNTNGRYGGGMDDIRIYNRALSDLEVTTIYNSEK